MKIEDVNSGVELFRREHLSGVENNEESLNVIGSIVQHFNDCMPSLRRPASCSFNIHVDPVDLLIPLRIDPRAYILGLGKAAISRYGSDDVALITASVAGASAAAANAACRKLRELSPAGYVFIQEPGEEEDVDNQYFESVREAVGRLAVPVARILPAAGVLEPAYQAPQEAVGILPSGDLATIR